ncbi:hypothetical protein ACFWHR_03650 [Leucobacter sp. NPDC058333]|uniref:hypothetical protein n=1 Tax=Leucobacter sp. NPDC058333 TaxID=3346450 RepID=UPI00364A0AA2
MNTQPTEPLDPMDSESVDLAPPVPPAPPAPLAAPAAPAAQAAPASSAAGTVPAETAPAGTASAGTASAGTADVVSPARSLPKPGPRTGPIVWGALILVFCGYIAQQAFGGNGLDTAGWIAATVIGLGVLLLGVGIAVLIRNARRPS